MIHALSNALAALIIGSCLFVIVILMEWLMSADSAYSFVKWPDFMRIQSGLLRFAIVVMICAIVTFAITLGAS